MRIVSTLLCTIPLIQAKVLIRTMSTFTENNPLLSAFTRFGGLPPFEEVKAGHYKPAFDQAMSKHLEELKAIADCSEPPSFQNTIEPFDKAGSLLMKVGKVFYNLCASHCPPELQAVQTEMVGISYVYYPHFSSFTEHNFTIIMDYFRILRLLHWPNIKVRHTCFLVCLIASTGFMKHVIMQDTQLSNRGK